ncbi:Nucleoporin [Erysiphe necator]|uniref:Putative nuclear pore complex component n=1 Tax=Uncinula necator TaxID=52586 RepID=A0A0B1P4T5_UNCNE|nr:Nucleoporin [Erysiphe necator]KHJ31951.1 putative nuclear pore complex component [Erysiphe necator]
MITPPLPSTPVNRIISSSPPAGTWQHPRLDEIVSRQNACSFDKRNIKSIIYNTGVVFAIIFAARQVTKVFPFLLHDSTSLKQYIRFLYYFIQAILVYNIIIAFLPLFRQTDDLADIPLTPAQRKLLGLSPLSAAHTPGSKFNTPPRYARTSTPLSGSPIGLLSPGKENASFGNFTGSPLSVLEKFGGINTRSSFGPKSLSPNFKGIYETPGTPTPCLSKEGVTVSSKWLYEKGRRSSVNSRIYN